MTEAEEAKEFEPVGWSREIANEFLQGLDKERLDQFSVELEKFLVQKNFQLIATPFIDDDGRIRAQIRGMPRRE